MPGCLLESTAFSQPRFNGVTANQPSSYSSSLLRTSLQSRVGEGLAVAQRSVRLHLDALACQVRGEE